MTHLRLLGAASAVLLIAACAHSGSSQPQPYMQKDVYQGIAIERLTRFDAVAKDRYRPVTLWRVIAETDIRTTDRNSTFSTMAPSNYDGSTLTEALARYVAANQPKFDKPLDLSSP